MTKYKIKLLSIRTSHLTNSSTNHYVILLKNPAKMQDITIDNLTILTTKESKGNVLVLKIIESLERSGISRAYSRIIAKEILDVSNIENKSLKITKKSQDTLPAIGTLPWRASNSKSLNTLPVGIDDKFEFYDCVDSLELDISFINDLYSFLSSDNVVIARFDDNFVPKGAEKITDAFNNWLDTEKEIPIFSGERNYSITPPKQVVARKSKICNFWTVFNKENGNKVRIRLDRDEIEKDPDNYSNNILFSDYPESLEINITDRCNFGCPYCYRECSQYGFNATESNLDAMIKIINKYGIMEVVIGGGDVLLNHTGLKLLLDSISENTAISITLKDRSIIEAVLAPEDSILSQQVKSTYSSNNKLMILENIKKNCSAIGVSLGTLSEIKERVSYNYDKFYVEFYSILEYLLVTGNHYKGFINLHIILDNIDQNVPLPYIMQQIRHEDKSQHFQILKWISTLYTDIVRDILELYTADKFIIDSVRTRTIAKNPSFGICLLGFKEIGRGKNTKGKGTPIPSEELVSLVDYTTDFDYVLHNGFKFNVDPVLVEQYPELRDAAIAQCVTEEEGRFSLYVDLVNGYISKSSFSTDDIETFDPRFAGEWSKSKIKTFEDKLMNFFMSRNMKLLESKKNDT